MPIYNNSVFITVIPGDLPRKFTFPYYRGDSDSFVFVCREADNTTPFDIRVADSYKCQIRDKDGNLIASLDPVNDFVESQSNECVQYLSDNSLPADDIYDELQCIIQKDLLENVEIKDLYTDVEFTVGDDRYTLGNGKIKMKIDQTR